MKNVKTRKDNFFEEFLYTTPFNEKNSQLAKNTDNDLVENIIYTP